MYGYVRNNPLRLVDPNGTDAKPSHLTPEQIAALRAHGPSAHIPAGAKVGFLNQPGHKAGTYVKGGKGGGGAGQPPKSRIAPSPPSPPASPSGTGRPSDSNVPQGPGEHHAPEGKGTGNAKGNGTGTGPGATMLDSAAFVQGMLGMQPPSDDGVSGGIPGGVGDKEHASSVGQAAWIAVQVLWGKVVGAVKKFTQAVEQKLAQVGEQKIAQAGEQKLAQAGELEIGGAASPEPKTTLPGSGPIPRSVGAMSRAEQLARKLKMNVDSPTTRQVLNNIDENVGVFIKKYREGGIYRELPWDEIKDLTLEKALQHSHKVRKLLTDGRWLKK